MFNIGDLCLAPGGWRMSIRDPTDLSKFMNDSETTKSDSTPLVYIGQFESTTTTAHLFIDDRLRVTSWTGRAFDDVKPLSSIEACDV